MTHRIQPPYYPIVYVRGYAMTRGEQEETFHDTYYGFAATSVEKREAPPPEYFQADVFEGQFIRFMKMEEGFYADASNQGVRTFHANPTRSIWISRFYDRDFFESKTRPIEDHAQDLYNLVFNRIPEELIEAGVSLGVDRSDYKVILVAHSMGGLVCRTLIQKLLPAEGLDPKDWIHRFVTMGTPHRGIELGRIPDWIEDPLAGRLNPFDAGMFKEDRMRRYLHLEDRSDGKFEYDIHSLGEEFPIKRCLNIIGSDHGSYNPTRHVTGAHSDGLVKQSRAYVVSGKRPGDGSMEYPDAQRAYWANVHRAHSGRRGIVNSFESFENIRRFLFGNIVAQLWLEDIVLKPEQEVGVRSFFDIEFRITIRGTTVYLHRREQDPCENAIRLETVPSSLLLHTLFMNSSIKTDDRKQDPFSHFAFSLRVVEHRVKERLLWDKEYPGREIFSESIEVRAGDSDPANPGDEVSFRSFGSDGDWEEGRYIGDGRNVPASVDSHFPHAFELKLRSTSAFSAKLVVRAGPWPNPVLTED